MKKSLFLIASLLAFSTANAQIFLPNAKGHILPTQPFEQINNGNSKPVNISLDSFRPHAVYNVICNVHIENRDEKFPNFVRYDIEGLEKSGGYYNGILIDEKPSYSHQQAFKDNQVHTVKFENISTAGKNVSISITRLDGWMIPFAYDCYAEFAIDK